MAEEKATETVEKEKAAGGNGGRWRLGAVVVAVLILIAGFFWLRSRGKESTDDAQVDGHITQIAPTRQRPPLPPAALSLAFSSAIYFTPPRYVVTAASAMPSARAREALARLWL